MAGVRQVDEPWTLEIDLGPFEARFPKMTRRAPSCSRSLVAHSGQNCLSRGAIYLRQH